MLKINKIYRQLKFGFYIRHRKYLPCKRWAEAAAYKSVACDKDSESTAPVGPSDDVFIWGRSRISLTEKLDVRGILISNNLYLTTHNFESKKEKK